MVHSWKALPIEEAYGEVDFPSAPVQFSGAYCGKSGRLWISVIRLWQSRSGVFDFEKGCFAGWNARESTLLLRSGFWLGEHFFFFLFTTRPVIAKKRKHLFKRFFPRR